jgi:hypothetical protein
MSVHDLPLFAWEPPKQILLFPLTRRVGKIRHTALKLASKHGDDAELYWKQVVASQRKHLQRVGLSPVEADEEIVAFFDAVQAEIGRMSFDRYPGGAA